MNPTNPMNSINPLTPLNPTKSPVMAPRHRPAARLAALLVLLALWACATRPPEQGSMPWTCDPQADSAVNSGQWEQALLRHQAYLKDHPNDCLSIYHLGFIWGHLGERAKEAAQYEQAAVCGYNKDDMLYFNLGMAYAEMDQLEKAIAAFQQAVALKPLNAENHFGLGLAARSAGRSDLARKALEKAVDLDPGHWDARLELARLDLDQGRLNEARIQLEAVQQGAPDHEGLDLLWGIYNDRRITTFQPEP
jgi:tetratricopeptide (TPR) repeat protein